MFAFMRRSRVQSEAVASYAEKSQAKAVHDLDKRAMISGLPADRVAALEAHLRLEALREKRHCRLLAALQKAGATRAAEVEEQRHALECIVRARLVYIIELRSVQRVDAKRARGQPCSASPGGVSLMDEDGRCAGMVGSASAERLRV